MSWSGPTYTAVDIPASVQRIRYTNKIGMLGSCFAEHISSRLSRYKYNVLENPFGILYNPASLATSVYRIVHKNLFQKSELTEHAGLYHSMDHHGSFSGTDADAVVNRINQNIENANAHLQRCSFVCVSPGTSLVYRYKPTGAIAGNCHKIPQTSFDRYRLSVEECFSAFENLYLDIKSISPGAHILWTVSPVRHVRDGLTENQKSKATLIVALDQISTQYPDTGYFPAYEIMIDQLRDYRYYARDLTHPSAEAIDIIWDLFRSAYLDEEEVKYHPSIEKIKRSMEHRLLHDDLRARHAFASGQLEQIEYVQKQVAYLDWDVEKKYFSQLLLP